MDQHILHVVDGNPGAMEVMIKLVQQYPEKVESVISLLHLWTFKTPILALKNLNDLNKEFILSIG